MTTGFTIGAASMNVTAAAGETPLRASRRATGTDPHSQTGKAMPASAAAGSCAARGSRARRANDDAGTNTSIVAETSAPSATNGMASISSEPKTIRRFRSHAICIGCATRARIATPSARRSPRPTCDLAAALGDAGARGGACVRVAISSTARTAPRRTRRHRRTGGVPSGAVCVRRTSTASGVLAASVPTRSRNAPRPRAWSPVPAIGRGRPRGARRLPVAVTTRVASGTARRTSATMDEVTRSSRAVEPSSATARRSGAPPLPQPCVRNPRTSVAGSAPARKVRSRTGPVPYQRAAGEARVAGVLGDEADAGGAAGRPVEVVSERRDDGRRRAGAVRRDELAIGAAHLRAGDAVLRGQPAGADRRFHGDGVERERSRGRDPAAPRSGPRRHRGVEPGRVRTAVMQADLLPHDEHGERRPRTGPDDAGDRRAAAHLRVRPLESEQPVETVGAT